MFVPVLAVAVDDKISLMPYPQQLSKQSGTHHLSKNQVVFIKGMSEKRQQYLRESFRHLFNTLAGGIETTSTDLRENASINILVSSRHSLPPFNYPTLEDDASYELTITSSVITIQANTEFGALHGFSTLSQLIGTSSDLSKIPNLIIKDQPRFKWRGLLIDSVRHFIPVATIKRQLDGMVSAKLNVFHWHLTDDQGWRIESKAYPKLHQQASDNQFYTQQEIKSVVEYAAIRGIRVVPEFDVPGHASAIAVAYPELMSQIKQYQMEDGWGVFEPLLDPSNQGVYIFINDIIAELTELFPDSYLHIGGDEVNPKQWEDNTKIRNFMRDNSLQNSHELHAYFNEKVQKILTKHQRKMMGWDEIFQPNLPADIVVQSWRGLESLANITSENYQGLLSTGFYLDQPQSSAYHYRNEPLTLNHQPQVNITKKTISHHWHLTIPRLKGSSVKGELTLLMNNNQLNQGFIKLNNNHHKAINIIEHKFNNIEHKFNNKEQSIIFTLDTWMGPLRAELNLADAKALTGRVFIGNAFYPVNGFKNNDIKPIKIVQQAPFSAKQADNILGGEAALWSEMVTEKNIDLRTWPRLFVVAERLWSNKDLVDIDNMYKRLEIISTYSSTIIGLNHKKQQAIGFYELLRSDSENIEVISSVPVSFIPVDKSDDINALLLLAEAIEPAHYYTRHHLKFQQNAYHQNESLDLFVDYLPAESLMAIKIKRLLKAYLNGDKNALQALNNIYLNWKNNLLNVRKMQVKHPKLEQLTPIINDLETLITTHLAIMDRCERHNEFIEKDASKFHADLKKITNKQKEMVLATSLDSAALLSFCRQNNNN
jgi:hexosaminidase